MSVCTTVFSCNN